jgi:hypothetical protein
MASSLAAASREPELPRALPRSVARRLPDAVPAGRRLFAYFEQLGGDEDQTFPRAGADAADDLEALLDSLASSVDA